MSGSPLPRTGRSGDSWLTPFPNLLMPDGWRTPREKMITTALRKRTLSPVRLVLKVTFFCCSLPQWCFFVFWAVLTRTRTRGGGGELWDWIWCLVELAVQSTILFCDFDLRATHARTRVHFCSQHWLLLHPGLYVCISSSSSSSAIRSLYMAPRPSVSMEYCKLTLYYYITV